MGSRVFSAHWRPFLKKKNMFIKQMELRFIEIFFFSFSENYKW